MTINPNVTSYENNLIIEGLRKLALQRDTLRKYASDEDSDNYDEDNAEQYSDDIDTIRSLLALFNDPKALVLKSERKARKITNASAVTITKAQAKVNEGHAKSSAVISKLIDEGKLIIASV